MLHKKKYSQGVITALVAGMMLGVLSLGTLVLELGRYVAAQTQLSAAAGSGASSMIAFYDSDLYERYGLLAIDHKSFTESRCKDYVQFNSDLNNNYNSNNLSTLYDVEQVEMTGLYNLTYPSVLKRQLLTRAKYHVVATDYVLNTETAESFFRGWEEKCRFVAAEMDQVMINAYSFAADTRSPATAAALTSLADVFKDRMLMGTGGTSVVTNTDYNLVLSDATVKQLPSKTGTVKSPSTADDEQIIDNTVLNAIDRVGEDISALGTVTEYNETDISAKVLTDMEALSKYMDHAYTYMMGQECYIDGFAASSELALLVKDLTQSMPAAYHMLQSDLNGQVLLNNYIIGNFSNKNRLAAGYMGPSAGKNYGASNHNTTFHAACTEYIIAGNASEKQNQTVAYRAMLAIRMINNLYMLLNQPEYDPYDPSVVATYLAWAYYESCVDMWLLSEYNLAVPFNKTQPLLPMHDPARITAAFATRDFADGMSKLGWYNGETFVIPGSEAYNYTDTMSLLMWFVPNSTKLLRVADLIQLEMRYRQQYVNGGTATFLMSEQNTYCRVKVTAKLRAMLPIISLGSTGSIQGTSFRAIRYSGY